MSDFIDGWTKAIRRPIKSKRVKTVSATQTKPRPITVNEERVAFLKHMRFMAKYWAGLPDKTPLERCDGLAFSILVAIDGGSMGLPGYNLGISVHPSDKAYRKEQGENWHKNGLIINDCQLHDLFHGP